eukprot:TRINITY_DN38669_c0_g1_i1.p1 TRINITY_DN38669_c0_g1~~TRINITY_DN38669_c0_g1_i1.p1  ORF type:complete len:322 (+),score=-4.08 TRINITY_DN38669_c0_g1_i1:16-981(+)
MASGRCFACRKSSIALVPSVAGFVVTCITALGFGIYAMGAGQAIWQRERTKGASYCEGIRENAAVKTPINSWSNLPIATASGWAVGRAIEQYNMGIEWPRLLLLLCIGLSQFCLCIGSFAYHAVLNTWGHWLDTRSMYWVINAALASTAWRWYEHVRPLNEWVRRVDIICCFLIKLAMDFYLSIDAPLRLHTLFTLQFAIVAVSEIAHTIYFWRSGMTVRLRIFLSVLGLALAAVAYAFREAGVRVKAESKLGGDSAFCSPLSFFQPHAVWHVCSGFGLLVQNDIQMGPISFFKRTNGIKEACCDADSGSPFPDALGKLTS